MTRRNSWSVIPNQRNYWKEFWPFHNPKTRKRLPPQWRPNPSADWSFNVSKNILLVHELFPSLTVLCSCVISLARWSHFLSMSQKKMWWRTTGNHQVWLPLILPANLAKIMRCLRLGVTSPVQWKVWSDAWSASWRGLLNALPVFLRQIITPGHHKFSKGQLPKMQWFAEQ